MSFNQAMNVMLPSVSGKSPHITGPYGEMRGNGPHKGVDFNYIGGQSGINLEYPVIHSPIDGNVTFIGGDYGTIKIKDASGFSHEILHTNTQLVSVGKKIAAGAPVGTMGGKGPKGTMQYAMHVHYQVKNLQGTIVDPVAWWDEKGASAQPFAIVSSSCFPVVTEKGDNYKNSEDIYKLLEKETSGFYLLSAHNFWHGGLHFTDASVPHHVKDQSIRCMMDGNVIAYRLNKEYLTSDWLGNQLQYSSSFCLIQHDYESPENTEEGSNKGKKNKLTFYSLYMHLAPYSVYVPEKSGTHDKKEIKQLKLKQTIRVRMVNDATPGTPPVLGHLGAGSVVNLNGETAQFTVQEQSGSHRYSFIKGVVSDTQGKTDSSVTKGAIIWIVDDAKYTEHLSQQSASTARLPAPAYWQCKMKGIVKYRVNARQQKDSCQPFSEANSETLGLLNITAEFEFDNKDVVLCCIGGKQHRMAKAMITKGGYADKAGQPPSPFWVCIDEPYVTLEAQAPTQFDCIVKCNQPIKAGDAIGFMGLYEVPKMPASSAQKVSKHQVHIELFTTEEDGRINAFLKNDAGLKMGKQYVKIKNGASIYVKNEENGKVSFDTAGLKTTAEKICELKECRKETDSNKGIYYKVSQLPVMMNPKIEGYISEQELEILSQYDLAKLGFRTLEEKNADSDGYLDLEKLPEFFQRLYKEIDTDGKNGVDSVEIAAAFKDKTKRNKLVKLVAKHPSEWHSLTIGTIQSTLSNWASETTEKETQQLIEHEKIRMNKLEWMSRFFGPMVWHFNPIEFVCYLIKSNNKIKLPLSKSEFISLVYAEAKKEQEISRVPAGITTAQAILETGYGKSVPTDIDTGKYSYNLFGIKAHGNDSYVTVWTHEEINGKSVRIKDRFMVYESFEDSIKGRVSFFVKNKRYNSLFESSDSEVWAKGLQDKGYATDSKYAEKLISIMNQWGLK